MLRPSGLRASRVEILSSRAGICDLGASSYVRPGGSLTFWTVHIPDTFWSGPVWGWGAGEGGVWLTRFRSGSPSRGTLGAARDLSLLLSSTQCPGLSVAILLQRFFHGSRNDFVDAFAQCRHIFLCESLGLYGVVQKNRNFRRPEHPVARPVMLKGSHETDGHDGNAELLRDAEAAVLELIHVAVPRPLGLGKNNQAGAAIRGVLREPPHALQIGRAPDIRHRDVAEPLHQPAVRRNLEVGFQLPSADKLRDRAVEHERIEKIDVIGHEERSAVGIEAGSSADLDLRAGKKYDPAAEGALQPVMFASIQEDAEQDEQWHNKEEMQAADDPKNRAAEHQPGPFHI